ncbi:MAG: hypothetical protein ACOYB2_10715 [Limnohabitans sp.]
MAGNEALVARVTEARDARAADVRRLVDELAAAEQTARRVKTAEAIRRVQEAQVALTSAVRRCTAPVGLTAASRSPRLNRGQVTRNQQYGADWRLNRL